MHTSTLHSVATRAMATFLTLIATAAVALPAGQARAEEATGKTTEVIFEGRAEAGYRVTDADDDRSRVSPYDALEDAPVLGLDVLYLTPGFGSLRLESGFLTDENWGAQVNYNHGADVAVDASTRAFTHDTGHLPTIEAVDVPTAYGEFKLHGTDADPGDLYRSTLQESRASVQVRIPGYPAHLRASGRIYTRTGDQEMRYFTRSCGTEYCHVNSRTRRLDQETKDYTLGFNTHAGPIDLAYSHAVQTFTDEAADPIVTVEAFRNGLAAGDYAHDVNPDLRSASNSVSINTNLSNRVVVSAAYNGASQENETSDVTRRTQNYGATVSWRPGARTIVVARYSYDEDRSDDLGAEARALREASAKLHTSSASYMHSHAIDPEQTRHTGELSARFSPAGRIDLAARVRYRERSRHTLIEKDGSTFVDEYEKTRSTLVGLEGRLRPVPKLSLEPSVGYEWTEDPLYAVEATGTLRYGLSGTWTPAEPWLLRASWQAFRSKNDEAAALQYAYAGTPDLTDPERTVTGNAYSLAATFIPKPEISLTATWTLTDNDIEQDMVFGSVSNYSYSFLSPDTDWSGRSQVAALQARWQASRRLTLTAGGSWIDSLEHYKPNFVDDSGLEESSTVEFTKLVASLEAEVRLTDAVGLTLAAFWATYDDQVDDADDATGSGMLASVGYRW